MKGNIALSTLLQISVVSTVHAFSPPGICCSSPILGKGHAVSQRTNTNGFRLGVADSSDGGNLFDQLSDQEEELDQDQLTFPWKNYSPEELIEMEEEWLPNTAQMSKVFLVGRVGSDPQPKYFDNGNVVVNLNLAVRRKYHYLEREVKGIKSGDEATDWYGLTFWRSDAEYVAKYVSKGMRIGVNGALQIDKWQDKMTGEPRMKTKVVVQEVEILETRAETELRRSTRNQPRQFNGGNYDDDDDDDDDEIAFRPAGAGDFF